MPLPPPHSKPLPAQRHNKKHRRLIAGGAASFSVFGSGKMFLCRCLLLPSVRSSRSYRSYRSDSRPTRTGIVMTDSRVDRKTAEAAMVWSRSYCADRIVKLDATGMASMTMVTPSSI